MSRCRGPRLWSVPGQRIYGTEGSVCSQAPCVLKDIVPMACMHVGHVCVFARARTHIHTHAHAHAYGSRGPGWTLYI